MRKLKKNYERKSNSVLAMSVCWCPCEGANCACWDANTQNYNNYQSLVEGSRSSTTRANYE
jgi:hypothetical protein